ncbi:MAG: RNA polymerase-associated protein RapA, partial [Armatimonadetes bacterium]|nr:RNA polymerase-associated protein RapA [Armatimonadota bacterium]
MKQVTTEYTPGQRVVNEAEPALGLGTVARVLDHRNVEIEFRAADTTRVYNVKTAPLRRLILAVGQEARGRNGERFKVDSVHRKAGLLVYRGNGSLLHEKDLADDAPSDGAVEKLLGGQLSPFSDFELRFDGWKIRQAALNPDTRGLVGARVRLLPHQLYIAHEVSRRELPRVLLADEVGLGKTIEAGLIFSVMRALGRAERVLVLVPESLVHQWLAEFYRRFNEMFTVLDEERCEQLEEKEFSAFQVARRMICNIDWLVKNPRRLKQAEQVRWDLVIVDEAHHLEWKGSAYQAIDRLSQRAKGLLLLTATPMRDGLSTEFGLLRLVDPERFHDFKAFQEEQAHLGKLARLARKIADGKEDLGPLLDQLATLYPHDEGLQHHVAQLRKKDDKAGRRELIGALVDRHGTGRVLIRNRRDRLKGFPRRVLHPVGFDMPRQWRFVYEQIDPEALDLEDFVAMGSSVHNVHPRMLATSEDRPQRLEPATFKAAREADPRVPWLVSFLREHPRDKVLLICSRPSTVIALQEQIKHHSTVRTGVFHEGLSVVERDRQAAYFADPSGAQVLLCSEIGGEGRNFQFSHHLVLYDLPLHPDTLEQRIGRLDRIGQDHPIDIHALFVRETPQEALFAWLDRGLHAFEKPVHGSEHVMHRLSEDLLGTLRAWLVRSTHHAQQDARLESLLGTSAEALDEVRKARQKSIDYLVDLNSFDEAEGRRVMRAIDGADTDRALQDYMERLLDRFGVHDEELDAQGRRHIKPGDLMFVEVFPGLTRDDGIGATYKR